MQARDVMVTEVIAVRPETPVKEIASLMVSSRISGMPVIEESGTLVGIVTDGDIYRRVELSTQKARRGWLDMLRSEKVEAEDYTQAHGRVARDVMTTEVFAVRPTTSLTQIADLFETKRIRRVPVVENGLVVGIVSRANLVQALAAAQTQVPETGLQDRHIRDPVLAEFKRVPWGAVSEGNVIVTDGVLHLWGFVSSDTDLAALRVTAEAVPGVRGFEDHTIRFFGDVGAKLRNPSKVTVIGPGAPEDASTVPNGV